MATLLICYDLNRPGQDYENLHDRIKLLGTSWWHHLDSTWLVTAELTPHEAHDALAPHVDHNDELLVIDVTGRSWWGRGFTQQAFSWLHTSMAAITRR